MVKCSYPSSSTQYVGEEEWFSDITGKSVWLNYTVMTFLIIDSPPEILEEYDRERSKKRKKQYKLI